jgi:hypothetical protein
VFLLRRWPWRRPCAQRGDKNYLFALTYTYNIVAYWY